MNIKIKFLIFNTVLAILTASGLGILSVVTMKNLLTKQSEHRGIDIAERLAEFANINNALKVESAILASIQDIMKRDDILAACVYDVNGKIVAHSDIREVDKVVPVHKELYVRYAQAANGIPYIVISAPILSNDFKEEDFLLGEEGGKDLKAQKFLGSAQIHLSLEKVHTLIHEMMLITIGIMAGAIVIATALVLFFLNLLLSPLQKLKRDVEIFGAGDLSRRVEIASNDEIGDLSHSFNDMAERLEKTLKLTEDLNKNLEAKVNERTKQLEAAQFKLVQSEKMSAVGQLAAGVAHEINNPLGVIMGFAQGLANRLKPGDPYELPIKSIEREALRCKNLVQDLLTFSRTSVGDREPQDLNKILEETVTLIASRAKMVNVGIEKDLSQDLPKILCNQNQIQQVIINLTNNAIDAMPQGGNLRISTRLLEENPLSWVSLKITDSGAGIPPAIVSRIFEPFFTTKEVGKGTGLGLSLVHEIVRKHSGSIEVKSRLGETEFHIQLPARTGREIEEHLDESRSRLGERSWNSQKELSKYGRGGPDGKSA